MAGNEPDKVVRLEAAAARLRDDFVAWQCRLRQLAVRELGGRPTPGMRPRVLGPDGAEVSAGVVVLLNKRDPRESISLFRHQVLKTLDPAERYDKALEILSASYFQHPAEFNDQPTALFGPGSPVVERLLRHGRCALEFAQFAQTYRLPCAVALLEEDDEAWQATYWHNRLYNDAIPAGVQVLRFAPDWSHAGASREG
jgi:hypothetical protein